MKYLVGAVSILSGLLLLCCGALYALFAAGFPQRDPPMPGYLIFLCVFGIGALLASGFLYAPVILLRPDATHRYKIVASVLLALPTGFGLLMQAGRPEVHASGLALAGAGALVLGGLVWRRAPASDGLQPAGADTAGN